MAEYIEREALIEHMKDLPTWWADSGGVYGQAMKYPEGMFDCDDVINSVANAPAADVVEVRHGEWVEVEPYCIFECSNCEYEWYLTNLKEHPLLNDANYCPNCGADMRGKNNAAD